jgi:phosphoserine phosphatase
VARLNIAAVAERDAPYVLGRNLAELAQVMDRAPYLDDIAAGVSALREQGIVVLLCTVTWTFAAQSVADRFCLDGVCGCEMAVDSNGVLLGRVRSHFEPADKVRFVAARCEEIGTTMNRVVAIGDGRSDLPLFAAAGLAFGLNASNEVRAAADLTVDSRSFMDAASSSAWSLVVRRLMVGRTGN